jgi:glycogen synthase
MKILMLVATDVAHDSRVLREARALVEQGHGVRVLGKDVPPLWTAPAGVEVESVSGGRGLRPTGTPSPQAKSALHDAARWALLPRHRQRVWRTWGEAAKTAADAYKFDVVHAHDFNVLRAAEQVAAARGAMLVYDSHEWWSGRHVHGRPTPLERAGELREERRIVAHADAVLTVSEGIAQRLGQWRDPAAAPVALVRNTFPRRDRFAEELTQTPVWAVYAGRIGPARDLEVLLEATAALGLGARLLGPADREFLGALHFSTGSVRIDPALPVDEVDDVLRRGGISVVTLEDSCENHRLALPNKLFHAVRAGVPVVAADLPEMRRMVTAFGLGRLYRPGDAASMREALQAVMDEYPRWCAQVAAAADELCWDRDAAVLTGVYDALARRRPGAQGAQGAR